MLRKTRVLQEDEFTLRHGNGTSVAAAAVGEVHLVFNNKFLILNNIYYVPNFFRNIISFSRLSEQLFTISSSFNSMIISRNGLNICSANLKNGLYVLYPYETVTLNTEMFKLAQPKSIKGQKVSNDSETYLWHLRLGHISLDRINRLTKDGPLKELTVGSLRSVNPA